jgi:hypothetical protein
MRGPMVILPLLLALFASVAQAASVMVTNLTDAGAGSLRQAVQDYAPGDTIRFAPGLTGTITNVSTVWTFTRSVTVLGPGAGLLALSGGTLRPLFVVQNGEVRISDLTLRNGVSGGSGPMVSDDTLRLARCSVLSNQGGAAGAILATAGVLQVTDCTFEGNSGGGGDGAIQTAASTTITGSMFRANDSSAIQATAALVVANCTFTGNQASFGGALRLLGPAQSVHNCTISGNHANVGGGGVYASGSLPQFQNTIIAGNTGPSPDYSGPASSLGFNLIGDASGSTGFGAPGSHDQVGSAGNTIAANLATLGDYGGPTRTMPPKPGSLAIDQGKSAYPLDQRGRARGYDQPSVLNPNGGDASDIGAYELRPGLLMVTTLADAGPGSLRQAVADVHPYDADSIKFAANVRGTITLTSGAITCAKPGVIKGPRSWELAIHGNNASRLFAVNANVAFDFLDLTMTGGWDFDGIALLASGNTALRNCRVVGNNLRPDQFALGGVIREVPPANLTLENCTIANNTTGFGGGVFVGLGSNSAGITSIVNCTISGNDGFGIVSNGSTTTVLNSTITNNSTAGSPSEGAAIFQVGAPAVALGGTLVAGNTGPGDVAGSYTSLGYNLIGKIGTATGLAHGVNHDRVGTAASPIAPGLGPLLANGGPGETHALLVGSQAIDKGFAFRPLDQRGAARYNDPAVVNESDGSDIGAYERNPTSTVAVDPLPVEMRFMLEAPRPNPAAGGVTAFASRLDSAGPVQLAIFDVAGRRVRDLVSATRPAGSYHDAWDGTDDHGRTVRTGVYFARLVVTGRAVSRSFVVLP